jgi:hypothetical protein
MEKDRLPRLKTVVQSPTEPVCGAHPLVSVMHCSVEDDAGYCASIDLTTRTVCERYDKIAARRLCGRSFQKAEGAKFCLRADSP